MSWQSMISLGISRMMMTLRNLSSPNDPYLPLLLRHRLLLRRPRPQRATKARPISHRSHPSIIHQATIAAARNEQANPFRRHRRISLLRRPIAFFRRPHLHPLHRHQHNHSRLWSISRTKMMIFPWLPRWQRDIEVLSRRVLMIFTAAVKRYVCSPK